MKFKNYITSILAGLCLTVGASASFAQNEVIDEEEINLRTIKTFFDSAFIKSEFDEDGDLKIEDDGLKTFIVVDEEKKMITYFSIWPLRACKTSGKALIRSRSKRPFRLGMNSRV